MGFRVGGSMQWQRACCATDCALAAVGTACILQVAPRWSASANLCRWLSNGAPNRFVATVPFAMLLFLLPALLASSEYVQSCLEAPTKPAGRAVRKLAHRSTAGCSAHEGLLIHSAGEDASVRLDPHSDYIGTALWAYSRSVPQCSCRC